MPNIKSAIKRVRTSEKARQDNQARKSRTRTARRKFDEAIASGEKSTSEHALRVYSSELDKAAKSGVIKANNASRKKSRAAAKVAAIA